MKLNLKGTYVGLFVLLFSTGSSAALMDKRLLLETIGDATTSTLCSEDYNKCFDVTAKTCRSDVKSILTKQCSSGIPAELNDMAEVQAHSGTAASCLTSKYIEKHKKEMTKNIKSVACQRFVK